MAYQPTSTDSDALVHDAIYRIYNDYGVNVSVEQKKKALLKFGRNRNVGSSGVYTIWTTGSDEANETYVAANTNSINSISSSSASDTGISVTVEGHTESGGNKTFSVQSVTLSGQTKVTLGTALNRASRVSNNSGTDLVGSIYVYEDTSISAGKPTDTTKIHAEIYAGKNQSEKASTSLSSVDYWIVTGIYADYLSKTGSNTAEVILQIRENGKVFKQVTSLGVSTGNETFREFKPYVIVPANADVRLVATASASTQDISGGINGFLATVV